jgi:SPP1 family predicted phage head-tail adaptor
MKVGRLREIITIRQKTDIIAESGKVTQNWSFFAQVFAEVRTMSGKEFLAQEKVKAQVSHIVTIRWLDGISEKMNILWGTRVLNIVHIGEDRDHARMMQLVCMEAKS